jgi:phage shock protein PspC (stress-responsive transcriptional regulator)
MQATDGRILRKGRTRMIGGVCSGLAEYFNIEVTIVRVIFVLAVFASGAGLLLYLLLWLFMPEAEAPATQEGMDKIRAGIKSIEADMNRIGAEFKKPKSGVTS